MSAIIGRTPDRRFSRADTLRAMRRGPLRVLAAAWMCCALATSVQADLATAKNAYQRGDYETALERLRPLAEAEDPEAQYLLGEMHMHGQGVARDFTVASSWFDRASVNGHLQAMANLGALKMLGLGVERQAPSAYYWLILSVVWSDSPLRGAAMAGLAEVAPQLSADEKRAIAGPAVRAWRRQ